MTESKKEKVMTGDFVVPGQRLGVIEEYIPGTGTYENNGVIYSRDTGFVLIDQKTKEIKVFSATGKPILPKRRDIVYGKVEDVKDKMIFVEIYKIGDKYLSSPMSGIVFVHKISSNYIKSAKDAFSIGDIIKASIIKVSNPLILTTNGRGLGVIMAFCKKCGAQLQRNGNILKCPKCGNIEKRYISPAYINPPISRKVNVKRSEKM
ncbi:MAG: exosome complex RNA-binding protein Csl4 [Candidatus Asgardarchaeia archaeon]